jgi:hypothetical protein
MSEDKRRGMIVLEFRMPNGEMLTEEARAQIIEGLERAFNFEIPGVTPELLSMFVQTWVGRSADGDRAEEILMRGRLEYPVELSASAQAAAADKYFGKDGELSQWRRVALFNWRHFKEILTNYEIGRGHGNSQVAIDRHAYSLAKMVPYLLGMPEEALGPKAPVAADSRQDASIPGLEFTDPGCLPTGPVPDAFEHDGAELCGAAYDDWTPPCSKPAGHETAGLANPWEHSNGDWHWGEPNPKRRRSPEDWRQEKERERREQEGIRNGAIVETNRYGPHHHEGRMPAYPSEGLDFTDAEPDDVTEQ